MAAITRRKEDYSRSSAEDMNRYLDAAQWSAPQKLALACRILAAEDHGSALAGQLTTRGDEPTPIGRCALGSGSTRSAPTICCWWTTICACSQATECPIRRTASIYGSTASA